MNCPSTLLQFWLSDQRSRLVARAYRTMMPASPGLPGVTNEETRQHEKHEVFCFEDRKAGDCYNCAEDDLVALFWGRRWRIGHHEEREEQCHVQIGGAIDTCDMSRVAHKRCQSKQRVITTEK